MSAVLGSTSEWFRQHPEARHWDRSYTKHVVDDLTRVAAFRHQDVSRIDAATSLLEDYWTTLHTPYEARDAARREVKARGKEIAALKAELALEKAKHTESIQRAARWIESRDVRVSALHTEIKSLRAQLTAPGAREEIAHVDIPATAHTRAMRIPRQDFFRCSHHPSAIDNFFAGRKACMYNCHNSELKWWEHGVHRMPSPT